MSCLSRSLFQVLGLDICLDSFLTTLPSDGIPSAYPDGNVSRQQHDQKVTFRVLSCHLLRLFASDSEWSLESAKVNLLMPSAMGYFLRAYACWNLKLQNHQCVMAFKPITPQLENDPRIPTPRQILEIPTRHCNRPGGQITHSLLRPIIWQSWELRKSKVYWRRIAAWLEHFDRPG